MSELINRLSKVFELAYKCLFDKINGGQITVENEASLQLQFAVILKTCGELMEIDRDEHFSIELEKPVTLIGSSFGKSQSSKAKIDIWFAYTKVSTAEVQACAVELKFFKKKNNREPNNRYDVFADIHNLEHYGKFAQRCFMVVVTDHDHYVSQDKYSEDTSDFDFRDGKAYPSKPDKTLTYRTEKPYGGPIQLAGSYNFNWDCGVNGLHFLKLAVKPSN